MNEHDDLFALTYMTMSKALTGRVKNADLLKAWRADIENLGQARREYHISLAKMLQSNEFTETGKATRKTKLQQALAARVREDVDKILGGDYDVRIDRLKRSATRREPPSELGQVLDYLRGQELRAEIRKLDPLMLRAEYESRSQDPTGKYDDWLRAVEDAPGGGMLPGEVLDRGREHRELRRLDDDTRQKIADLQELKAAHQHFIQLIERELPAPDPIAAQAAGEGESHQSM